MFTQDWLHKKDIIPYWERELYFLKGRPISAIEIGCFEGMSALWFLENVLTHPESNITVIDTFKGDNQTKEMGGNFDNLKLRFEKNIESFKDKVKIMEGESLSKLLILNSFPKRYELIYIDGSHDQIDVLNDAIFSFSLLTKYGILIFDDYNMEYTDKYKKQYKPKIAIDAFISVYNQQIRVLHKGWQLILQKI